MAYIEAHVVPNPRGGWDVVVSGRRHIDSHHADQARAEARARALLRERGGGQAVIHGRDGRIRESNSIEAVN